MTASEATLTIAKTTRVGKSHDSTLQPPSSAIALLIDLAQRGEIDPWDVDAIDAIDLALNELAAASNSQEGFNIADLYRSGQAFVDASLLVLLKANTLERLQNDNEDDLDSASESALADLEDWANSELPKHLERQLQRRRNGHRPTYRRVTLQELIEQLQLVAAAIEGKPARAPKSDRRSHSQSRAQAMRATLELAQEENSVEIAAQLDRILRIHQCEVEAELQWLDLDRLLVLWSQMRKGNENAEDSEDSLSRSAADLPDSSPHPLFPEQLHDRVNVFWALLLLSAQSKVELVQNEFYQDLKIRALGVTD